MAQPEPPEDSENFSNKTTMALLGQGFRPELGVYDYSAITRANEMMGMATANLGQQIGDGIKDYAKEQKELQADIAKGKTSLAHFKTLNPELSDKIDELGSIFKDPTKSKVEQAAAGRTMSDDVASFISSQRYGKEFAMKERELGMREQEFQQRYGATQMEIERQRASSEAKTQFEEANAPLMLESVLGALKGNPQTASLLTPEYVAQLNNMSPQAKLLSAQSLTNFLPEKEKATLVEKFRYRKNNETWEGPAYITPSGGAEIVPIAGARATMYGYAGDPTPDSNSSVGIGAFVPKAEQDKIKAGGDSIHKLRDNDFALSPDMEQAFRAQGIKPMETVSIQMENGDTVTGRWMDRTAQDDQIAAGKVPGVTKPLRGRIDFYTPGGVNPYDGSKIKGIARVDEVTAGAPVGSDMSPTEQIAVAKYQDEKAANEASAANNKAKAESALASLKEIRNHPGLEAATGKSSYFPSIRGGDSYDFEQKFDTAKGLAGTIGIEAMRGLGAMSEKEFEASKASIAALKLGMATESVAKELDKLISLFETKIANAVTPGGTPKATPAPVDPYAKERANIRGTASK